MRALHLAIAATLTVSLGVGPAAAEGFTRQQLQDIYVKHLSEEGYRPEVSKAGNVTFRKEGRPYVILIDEKDPVFFRMIVVFGVKDKSSQARLRRLESCNVAVSEVKVIKCFLDAQGDPTFAAEAFLPAPEQFKLFLERMLRGMDSAFNSYTTRFNQEAPGTAESAPSAGAAASPEPVLTDVPEWANGEVPVGCGIGMDSEGSLAAAEFWAKDELLRSLRTKLAGMSRAYSGTSAAAEGASEEKLENSLGRLLGAAVRRTTTVRTALAKRDRVVAVCVELATLETLLDQLEGFPPKLKQAFKARARSERADFDRTK